MNRRWIVAPVVVLSSLTFACSESIAFRDDGMEKREKQLNEPERGRAFYSRPVITKDKIVIANSTLYELDKSNGRIFSRLALHSPVSANLINMDGVTYPVTADRTIRAVKDGKVIWKSTLPASPVTAVSADTGKKLWDFNPKDMVSMNPIQDETRIYYPTVEGVIYAIDGSTGKVIWKFAD